MRPVSPVKIECGSKRSTVNPRLAGGASGIAPCVGLAPPLLLADGRERTLGFTHIFLLLLWGGRNCCPFGFLKEETDSHLDSYQHAGPIFMVKNTFLIFRLCLWPKQEPQRLFGNVMTSVLGQSLIFSVALPTPSPTCINIIMLLLNSK